MKPKKVHTIRSISVLVCMLTSVLFGQTLKAQQIIAPVADSCISADTTAATTTYFISPSTGITSIQWSTLGDIAIVGSSTGTSVSVKSRSTNTALPPAGHPPYGKGRLSVSYIIDSLVGCGPHVIYKDLYKDFTDTTDKIVGPLCVGTGDTVTYSIKPVVSVNLGADIGVDSYKWIIPSSWRSNILYYSEDSSSITFVVGTVSTTDSLIVGIGRCNLNQGQYVDTLVLGKKIPAPILSYPSCLPANSDTLVVKWTNPISGTFTSTWTKPSNWKTLSSSQDSIVLLVDDNPGTVKLTVINGCQTVDSSATINRSLGTNSVISGDTCVIAGSQQTYTVTNAPINTDLTWHIPTGSGWSYANADTTAQSIVVNVGTTAGSIYVTATACSSVIDTIHVNLKPANPSSLTGTTLITLCSKDSLTYTVNTVAGATGYGWIFPAGWSPATTTTLGTSAKVKPNGISGGQVEVFALGGCQNSDTLSLSVAYDTLAAPTSVTATKECLNVGLADTISFSVPTVTGITFGWQLPIGSGWTITSASPDSSIIHVQTTGGTGDFTIGAKSKDTCGGSSLYTNTTIDVTGLSFSVTQTPFSPFTVFSVNPNPVVGATAYQWYENGVAVPSGSGGNTASCFLLTSTITYPVCVDVTSESGCITQECVSGSEERPDLITKTDASTTSANTIRVSPNPTSGILNVQFSDASTRNIRLVNSNGTIVLSKTTSSENNTLDVSTLSSGTYFLIANSKQSTAVAKVVVSK